MNIWIYLNFFLYLWFYTCVWTKFQNQHCPICAGYVLGDSSRQQWFSSWWKKEKKFPNTLKKKKKKTPSEMAQNNTVCKGFVIPSQVKGLVCRSRCDLEVVWALPVYLSDLNQLPGQGNFRLGPGQNLILLLNQSNFIQFSLTLINRLDPLC